MSITHNTPVRTALADAVCNSSTGQLGANGKLVIYSGTEPANAAASLSGNTAIATITGVNFGAAASGVSTVTGSTADSNAVGGTASFFRLLKSDGTTVVLQGACGTSGSDLNMSSLTITSGQTVTLSSGTYTAPL